MNLYIWPSKNDNSISLLLWNSFGEFTTFNDVARILLQSQVESQFKYFGSFIQLLIDLNLTIQLLSHTWQKQDAYSELERNILNLIFIVVDYILEARLILELVFY